MKKSELFTQEMLETFTCHPYADAPILCGEGVNLSDVYRSYSVAKKRAYNYCRKLCDRFNGSDFMIVAHNCQFFSVQFEFENPLNGCIMIVYITPNNKHLYFK